MAARVPEHYITLHYITLDDHGILQLALCRGYSVPTFMKAIRYILVPRKPARKAIKNLHLMVLSGYIKHMYHLTCRHPGKHSEAGNCEISTCIIELELWVVSHTGVFYAPRTLHSNTYIPYRLVVKRMRL